MSLAMNYSLYTPIKTTMYTTIERMLLMKAPKKSTRMLLLK
jgi:hypothetical protein